MEMRLHSHEPVQDCQADGDEAALSRTSPGLPGCARAGMGEWNPGPPFQMQEGLPLQHDTMVYSMRSNRQQPGEHTGKPLSKQNRGQPWSLLFCQR